MAQQNLIDLLKRAVEGEIPSDELIRTLVDRTAGTMRVEEGLFIDFKVTLGPIGELARDILGFANAQGGILLFGVDDGGRINGHAPLNAEQIRAHVGPYIGTRVEYEIECAKANVQNRETTLPYILVQRTTAAYPSLLRREVEWRKGMWQKARYLAGSLPYREGKETKAALPGEDVNEIAQILGFKLVAPRTRSSFLVEDRPGMRVYDHINSRFIGRDDERAALSFHFDAPRGRGVSIAGYGGLGKTELAIALVKKLRGSRFHRIYSGSSKRMLLTPIGFQEADPEFHDYPSFLRDLCGWLGIEAGAPSLEALEAACVEELKRIGQRVLLFVDNLETIEDTRLLKFLDDPNRLPQNVWLLVTSRVHRVGNLMYTYDLAEMIPRDAARLLRHELKTQGLEGLANLDINELERVAGMLHRHPLAIRWFAWRCHQDRANWDRGPGNIPKQDLETFCITHTFEHLSADAVDALAIIACCQDQTEVDLACVAAIAKRRSDVIDAALLELERAGLVSVATDASTGKSTYGVVQLAVGPIHELVRSREMERGIAAGLRTYLSRPSTAKVDPLIRYLVEQNPAYVRHMDRNEIEELLRRIERAKKAPGEYELELVQLEAECYRHLNNPITAGRLYSQAAERVLENPVLLQNERYQLLLIEAATVTKQLGTSKQQLERIVRYLGALPDDHMARLRIPGLLCEAYAGLKDKEKYAACNRLLRERLDGDGSYSESQIAQAEAALARAAQVLRA